MLHGMKCPDLLLGGSSDARPPEGQATCGILFRKGVSWSDIYAMYSGEMRYGISYLLSAGSKRSRFRFQMFRSFSRAPLLFILSENFIRAEASLELRFRNRPPPLAVFLDYALLKEEHEIPPLSPKPYPCSRRPTDGCLCP